MLVHYSKRRNDPSRLELFALLKIYVLNVTCETAVRDVVVRLKAEHKVCANDLKKHENNPEYAPHLTRCCFDLRNQF